MVDEHEANDAMVLDDILFRFVSTEDEKFSAPLQRVLPKVLAMLPRPSSLIREKTMAILSHINKRLKMLPDIALPVAAIVDLFLSAPLPSSTGVTDGPDPNLMTQCCLVYIEKGFARMAAKERIMLSPLLLCGIASRPPSQQRILLHMFLAVLSLPRHVEDALNALPAPVATVLGDEKDTLKPLPMDDDDDDTTDVKRPTPNDNDIKAAAAAAVLAAANEAKAAEKAARDKEATARFAWANDTRDRAVVLQWLMDVLLFTPNMLVPWAAKQALEAKEKAAAAAASSMPGVGRSLTGAAPAKTPAKKDDELKVMVVPAGMSQDALDRITEDGKRTWSLTDLATAQTGVLSFVTATCSASSRPLFPDNDLLLIGMAGACAADTNVARRGEDVLRRLHSLKMEESAIVSQLMNTFMGQADQKQMDEKSRRSAASEALKIRILGHLSRSVAAANLGALAVKLVFDTLFSTTTTRRLQLQGLSFLTWILTKASPPAALVTLAPVYLKGLITLLAQVKAGAATAQAAAKRATMGLPPLASLATPAAAAPNNFPDRIDSAPPAQDFSGGSMTAVAGLQAAAEHHNATLRGRLYSLLGQLSLRAPLLFNGNTKMMTLFFNALTTETDSQVQQNVHEGLSLLRQAYTGVGGGLALELQTMLLDLVDNEERRVRLCAIQCMNRLFPFHDVRARYMCLSLLNDPSVEVRDEAKRGLQPHVHIHMDERKELAQLRLAGVSTSSSSDEKKGEEKSPASPSSGELKESKSSDDTKMDESKDDDASPSVASAKPNGGNRLRGGSVLPLQPYPPFPDFMLYAYDQHKKTTELINDPGLRSRRLQAIVEFAQHCFVHSATVEKKTTLEQYTASLVATQDSDSLALDYYRSLIEQGFDYGISDVQSACSKLLVRLVKYRPSQYAPIYAARLPWLKKFLQGGVVDTRRYMARLLQCVAPQLEESTIVTLLTELTATLEASFVKSTRASGPTVTSAATATALGEQGVAVDSDGVHGALLGVGVLLAESVRRQSSSRIDIALLRRACAVLVQYLEPVIITLDPDLSAAACKSLARVGIVAPLPLTIATAPAPTTLSSSSSSSSSAATTETKSEESAAKRPRTDGDGPSQSDAISRLLTITRGQGRKAGRVVEEATRALGAIAIGDRNHVVLQQITKGLFEMAEIKLPEIHFAVGTSLASIGTGRFFKMASDPLRDDNKTATPAAATAPIVWSDVTVPGESKSILENMLETIIFTFLSKGSLLTRAAGSTWLLCIVKHIGRHPVVQRLLPLIQAAFSLMLTEQDQFTQECASKGLAIVYQESSQAMKDELMDGLVKTFTHGKREVNASTQILVNADRGEFSTYKELCSVATEMGQPDLIYKFLDLASHHSIWNSRLGAAFSLGSIIETNKALAPHIAGLIPKLYRYQFDPNPKIKATMRQMWESMVAEPRETIDKHFNAIMKELLESMGGRQFRERQAACLALVDLLQSRSYNQVGVFIESLWEALYRVLDDVNEPVRKVASQLAKSMTSLCLRLCDPKYTTADGVRQSLAATLPTLLNKGIVERVTEVRSVSVNVLLKITAVAGIHLRPHLPALMRALLEGQSSLEPSAFSYLQFHTAAYNITPEQLEELRLQMLKSSPLADAVESCTNLIDADCISGVVEVIVDLMRTGVGLPTLSSCAKLVVTLATGSSRHHLTPHTSALSRVLLSGLMDQSPSIRKAYANALGYTCKVSKRKRVAKTITDLLTLYTSPHLASEAGTDKGRLVSGLALRAVVRRANEHAKEFASEIAPVAFVAMSDEDKEIQGVWTEVWDDLTPGREAGATLYLTEIVNLAVTVFTAQTSSYVLKVSAMKAVAEAATLTGLLFAPHLAVILPLILKSLPGRLWSGKEVLLQLSVNILKACKLRVAEKDVVEVARALIVELKREKRVYRRKAIEAVTSVVNLYPDLLDVFVLTREALSPVFEAVAKGGKESKDGKEGTRTVLHSSAVATAGMEDDDNRVDGVLAAQAYECIGAVWPRPPQPAKTAAGGVLPETPRSAASYTWYDTQREQASWLIETLITGLGSGLTWNVRVAILKSIKRIVETAHLQHPNYATASSPWSEEAKIGVITQDLADRILPALAISLTDGKFAAVRAAALEALVALVSRPFAYPLVARWVPLIGPHMTVLAKDRDSNVLRYHTQLMDELTKLRASGVTIPEQPPLGYEAGLTSLPALAASLAAANAAALAAATAAAVAPPTATAPTTTTTTPATETKAPTPAPAPEAEDLYD